MKGLILNDIIVKLNSHKGNWRLICDETGLGYEWISKLARNKISGPGICKIQRLYTYLNKLEKGRK